MKNPESIEIRLIAIGTLSNVSLLKIARLINVATNTINAVIHKPVKLATVPDYFDGRSYSDEFLYDLVSTDYQEKSGNIVKVGIIQAPIQDNFFVRSINSDCVVLTLFQTEEIYTKSNRTVEEYLTISLLPHLLWLQYKSRIPTFDYLDLFHTETRGCIFDFTGYKPSKVYKIREARIDAECQNKLLDANIPRHILDATVKILDSIRSRAKIDESDSVTQEVTKILKLNRNLRLFLCHSSKDKKIVRDLYLKLRKDGFNPWLDEEDLLPGQNWKREISRAVKGSDAVLVCLSQQAITKDGYVHREISYALDVASEKSEDEIFLIPIRLEECEVPERLQRWHWANLYDEKGYEKLILSLKALAESLTFNILENAIHREKMIDIGTSTDNLNKLLKILNQYFNEEEIITLCFHLAVDFDNLPAIGKVNKARELIKLLDRLGRIKELKELGKQIRPNAPW